MKGLVVRFVRPSSATIEEFSIVASSLGFAGANPGEAVRALHDQGWAFDAEGQRFIPWHTIVEILLES